MNFIDKITSLFKGEKKDVKLEDVENRVFKSSDNSSIIDSSVLNASDEELEKTKKEKNEIESTPVSDTDRNTLAELNTHAIGNLYGVHKKIF